jgi:hypothetical protein
MPRPIAVFGAPPGNDSGGAGACNTPPAPLAPQNPSAILGKVKFGGFPPILEGDVLTPAPGTTPKGDPCASPRTAISTAVKVRIGGRAPCSPGDVLNAGTGITIASGGGVPKIVVS